MRNILLSFFVSLLWFQTSFAQLSLRVFNYRPTGEFGFVMNPTFSVEIGYMKSFENEGRLRPNFSVTVLNMKPRMKTIPTYGVINGRQVLPGELSFQKYFIYQLNAGMDIAFIQKKKFVGYAGWQIILGGADVNYTNNVETIIQVTYEGGGILGGLRFNLGAEYDFNEKISVFANANRCVFLVAEPKSLNWANDYGIGMCYTF